MPDREIPDYLGMGWIRRQTEEGLNIIVIFVGDSGEKQTGLSYRPLLPDVNIFGKRPFSFICNKRKNIFKAFLKRFPVWGGECEEVIRWCGENAGHIAKGINVK